MRKGLGLGIRGWSGSAERTVRAASRRVGYLAGKAGQTPRRVSTFWWDQQPNFGDQLNIDVLQMFGIAPRWSKPSNASLIPIGSLIEHLPMDFSGSIWGSGMIFDKEKRLPKAEILALRGHLTWCNLGGAGNPVFGDPGLFAKQCYGPGADHNPAPIALVPHLTHRGLEEISELKRRLGQEIVVIDVTCPPADVVASIASSSAVVSTSLHGLVVADSLGLPAAWWQPNPPLGGGTFKFRDYESTLGTARQRVVTSTMTTRELRDMCVPVDAKVVDRVTQDLSNVLQTYVANIKGNSRFMAAFGR